MGFSMSAAPHVGVLAEIERHRIALRESREAEIRESADRQRMQAKRLAETGAFSADDPILHAAGIRTGGKTEAKAAANNALALLFAGDVEGARKAATTTPERYAVFNIAPQKAAELWPDTAEDWNKTQRMLGN